MISARLAAAMATVEKGRGEELLALAARLHREVESPERIPVSIRLPRVRPREGEAREAFAARARRDLEPLREAIAGALGAESEAFALGNALAARLDPDQIRHVDELPRVELVELNDLVHLVSMNDALEDVSVPCFEAHHPPGRGRGVRVAVLDTGVDKRHPFLRVAESCSVTSEGDEVPGLHGTHCAGAIASRDHAFPGVAPECELVNVKVADATGRGAHVDVVRGIERALEREADVLSLSLGFNHLPHWSEGGHAWSCPAGDCVLCRAVDSAVALGSVVVAAAGNEADRARALRAAGHGATLATEIHCPAQAGEALTVGALSKRSFVPASSSSRGPTAFATTKPDLAAPGVNIWSTVPVPRDALGSPIPKPSRALLFGRLSGTSMAASLVAGGAALLIEYLRSRGRDTRPGDVRNALLAAAVAALPGRSAVEVGMGRLDLSGV